MEANNSQICILTENTLAKASVVYVEQNGSAIILLDSGGRCHCSVTLYQPTPLRLKPDDRVIAWVPKQQVGADEGAVLCKIPARQNAPTESVNMGASFANSSRMMQTPPNTLTDSLITEDPESITRRYGKASVTFRKNGEMLLKGTKITISPSPSDYSDGDNFDTE